MEKTTCQICEREIKAGKGIIALHGYTRPWKQGWQSGSCFGAKYRPYEIACDALPPAIERCRAFIVRQKAHLEDFTNNPPAELTRHSRFKREPEVHQRPEGYVYNPEHGSYGHDQIYAYEHHAAIYQIKKSIEHAETELPRLEKRLANWKPKE